MTIDLIEKYNMLSPGDTVLAAVSGGKDSMCLLHLLLDLKEKMDIKVVCGHFDHRLRGAESDRDRDFVKDYCEKIGVQCIAGSGDVSAYAKENGLGLEEAARILRYEFLEKAAKETGAKKIATAHTADDNAETLLLNFSRGSGLKGLCGIPPLRGNIIRPMLDMTTAEVFEFLKDRNIPHVEDSTNGENFCARNKLRHIVLPELFGINKEFSKASVRCIELLREDEEYLDSIALEFIAKQGGGNTFSVQELAKLPYPVFSRVVRKLSYRDLSKVHVDSVLELCTSAESHKQADIPGVKVVRDFDKVIFGGEKSPKIEPQILRPGQSFILENGCFKVSCANIPRCGEIHNSVNTFFFKSDSICGNIVVASRRNGEKIRLAGRGCTKTLKKLFSESRLNGLEKDSVPVLYDDCGTMAVYGFGIDQRLMPEKDDDVIKVEIEKIR